MDVDRDKVAGSHLAKIRGRALERERVAVQSRRHHIRLIPVPVVIECADRIRDAYNACLVAGEKTRDLGGTLGTREFADAVIKRLA